jgi:hypothetical protein
MRKCCPHRIEMAVLLGLMILLAPLRSAEEAWRGDGRRVRGNLTLDGEQLRFQPTEGAAIASTNLTRIRFADATPTPFRAGGGRRVHLWDGEQITGQIVGLDKDKLRLRTAWAANVELPRAAVASVEALPGWRTMIHDDFRDERKVFTMRGDPKQTKAADGSTALLLNAAGQELAYTLSKPLAAGRFGVNFREQESGRGGRWVVELLFQHGEHSRHVTTTFAGKGQPYAVDAEGRKGTARKVNQTAGWHRLIVQFRERSLRLTCDDDVLWYNLDDGSGGLLRRVTIRCQRGEEGGAMAWTEFCLERAVVEHPKPPTEPEQDAIRLLDDDQLFGRILRADRRTIEIEGGFGKRALPWTALSGCSFRRPAAPPKANASAKVRLFVRSGLCAEADLLDGTIVALDDRKIVLRHALLGALTFERGRLRELHPHRFGPK